MKTNISAAVTSPQAPFSPSTWWIAARPFSFPASVMPVLFGGVMGATMGGGHFDVPLFLLSLIGMVLLHAASNIINDVVDYRRGLDRDVLPVSGAVVRRLLSPRQASIGASAMGICGVMIGVFIASHTTPLVLLIGAAGVAVGAGYSLGPLGLKYRSLGDLAVFLNFGVLGSLGSWVVQTRKFAWIPVFWAIPFSLLVIAIVHANNWRDMRGDGSGGFKTVAGLLGDRGSYWYYVSLLYGAYALLLVYMIVPRLLGWAQPMPYAFLAVFLSLPLAARLGRRAHRRRTTETPLDFAALDGATAQLNLLFGALCSAALLLHALYVR